jgi:hypothetical protein
MKRFILPLMLLLFVGSLFAVESAPSEVVGYFKLNISEGAYQAISLPFAYADLGINSVIGEQLSENDVVLDINSGSSTTFYSGFGWFGELENMAYGSAYFVNRTAGNAQTDYFLLGKVDPQPFTVTIGGMSAYTAFGINDAGAIVLDEELFGANETDGDVILDINSGASTVYYDGFGWFGELTEITPTSAYFYNAAGTSPGFTWTYTPGRGIVSQPLSRSSK